MEVGLPTTPRKSIYELESKFYFAAKDSVSTTPLVSIDMSVEPKHSYLKMIVS